MATGVGEIVNSFHLSPDVAFWILVGLIIGYQIGKKDGRRLYKEAAALAGALLLRAQEEEIHYGSNED